MPNILWLYILVVGLCLGSFLNVVILRDQKRLSILTGRSHCPHCGHTLAWYDLIPLLGFLLVAGHCRYCKKPISFQYPLVELTMAGLTALSFWIGYLGHGSVLLGLALLLALGLLLVVAVIDLRTQEISLEYVLLAGVIGGLGAVSAGEISWWQLLEGVLLGSGSLAFIKYGWLLLFKEQGMGAGDLWLGGALGAILGYPQIVIALFAAIFSGALIGVLLLALGRKELHSRLPFGPFLVLGLLIALIWGQSLINWYIL